MQTAVLPDEGYHYALPFAVVQFLEYDAFVFSVSLAYLSFYPVAIYGMFETPFRHAYQYLCTCHSVLAVLTLHVYHSYWEC